MSSWLESVGSSHKLQLAATAIVSGAVVGGAIIGLQQAKRKYKVYDLKHSIPNSKEKHDTTRVPNILIRFVANGH